MNIKTFLKICISAALIGIILSRIDWSEFILNVKSIRIELYAVTISLAILELAARALRWKLLLKVKGIDISLGKSLSFLLVGMFFGIFLPSSFGGDIAKMYDFSRYSSKRVDTVSSVFMERWTGIVTLSLLCVFAMMTLHGSVSDRVRNFILILFALLILASFFIFSDRTSRIFSRIVFSKRRTFIILREKIGRLVSSIQDYKNHKVFLLYALLLAFVVNLLRILMNFVNSQAAGFNIPFFYFFLFIPIITLIMMVPISISGIGVMEGTYLYFFSQVGLNPSSAVLLSWMGFVLVIAQAIAGGIIFGSRKYH